MAEDNPPPESGGRGAAVSEFLRKKTGPLPNGAWVFIAAAVLFYVYKKNAGAKGTGKQASGSDGAQGSFTSSQTSTDPTTGNQTSYTATGPTSGFLTGGGPTYAQASPMGYSGGDIFVNYPGQTTAPPATTGPPYPPVNATPAAAGQTGSWWYTLSTDVGAGDIANQVYQLGVDTSKAQPASTNSILAADLVNIMQANPQLDWTRITTGGGKLPAGTAIYVPLAGGIAGKVATLPKGASLTAPAGYKPPNQTTSMTAVS